MTVTQFATDSQYSTDLGCIRLVNYSWDAPIDVTGHSDSYVLQFCFVPVRQVSKACFPEHWGHNRFERFGQVSLLPPNELVHCVSELREQRSIHCLLDSAGVEKWLGRKTNWNQYPLDKLLDIGSSRIRHLLLNLGEEVEAPGFGGEQMIEMMTGQLVIELCRYLGDLREEKIKGGLSARNLRLVEGRVAGDPRPPSVRELADLCRLSARHLSRAFRVSKGRSIGEYITEWRVEHAKRLLAGGASIKSVAYEVGFSAPSNFSTAFLRETGESPTRFLQRARGPRLRGPAQATSRETSPTFLPSSK